MDIEMVTLASPKYIEKYGSPSHPKELAQHNCLTGSVKRWSFQSVENSQDHYDANIEGKFVCKNGHALVTGALSGNGIIRVPLMYCTEKVASGELVKILPQWQIPAVLFFCDIPQGQISTKTLTHVYRLH